MSRLPIADIRMHETLQPRSAIDQATVDEYAARMREGERFPPVVVFYDDTDHWLVDGYHRVYAAQRVNQTHVNVRIERGTFEDARWYSYGVNTAHGLKRDTVDKRRAIEAALSHPRAATLSDREIARHCGVDHKTVGTHRTHIWGISPDSSEREVTRNGTTYTMEIGNIGSHQEPEPEPPTLFDEPDAQAEAVPVVMVTSTSTPAPEPPKERTLLDQGMYTLEYWNTLAEDEQAAIIQQASTTPTDKRFNGQDDDNIEWARWSWNPVTGCYHGCIYCYARDIANRHYAQKFDATFLPDRLAIPRSFSPPADADHLVGYRNVFTCSMADLFGKWVPQPWIDAVLDTVRESPQWNFLFLTKFPIRLSEQTWPDNAWVGCTVDTQARVSSAERAFSKVKAGIKWLSCEPLLEPLKFSSLDMFDWVVIGGQSRSTQAPAFQPRLEWIASLEDQARAAGCQVYYKTNLLRVPKEYPGAKP